MSKITDKLIFDFIKFHYRPYDTHDEFGRGFSGLSSRQLLQPARGRQRLRSGVGPGGRGCDAL